MEVWLIRELRLFLGNLYWFLLCELLSVEEKRSLKIMEKVV